MKNYPFIFCFFLLFPLLTVGQSTIEGPYSPDGQAGHAYKNVTAVSNALEFDGMDNYVAIGSGTALISGLEEFSMCGWVLPMNENAVWPDFDGFFGIKDEGICDFYVVQINGTGIEARITTNTGTYTINPPEVSEVTPGEWHHYGLVYTGSELQLYLNGSLEGTVAASGEIDYNNLELTLGKLEFSTNDFFLDGKLDEVTIWEKALTEEEVQLYQCISGDPSGIEGLVAYYDFNEESGIVLPDYFGNYDGVLTGMTGDEWVASEVCESGFGILFHVTDEETSEPVEGAEIDLDGVIKLTNANGEAVFSNYDPGTYSWEVTKSTYYTSTGEVEVIDEDVQVDVAFAPILYYSITFVVTEDPGSNPIDSAIVNLDGLLQYTDETGTTTFDDYLPGSYTYNVSKAGYFLVPGVAVVVDDDLTIEVSLLLSGIGDNKEDGIVIYPNPASAVIRIKAEHAKDAGGEAVLLDLTGKALLKTMLDRGNGTLSVDGLPPGMYLLEVRSNGISATRPVMIK